MLVYHPALDCFHCAFRTLALLGEGSIALEIDKARILDFYQLFPHLLGKIRLPRELLSIRNRAKAYPIPYEHLGEPALLMRTLGPIQLAAYASLASTAHVDSAAFRTGLLSAGTAIPDDKVQSALDGYRSKNRTLLDSLISLAALPLSGSEGLKARTGLLDFRYDAP